MISEYRNGRIIRVTSCIDDQKRESVLPPGELTVWKACRSDGKNVIVELSVPGEAKRVTPLDPWFRYKSRVDSATVRRITSMEGVDYKEAVSCVFRGKKLTYRVGETIRPDGFDDNPANDCGQGINVHLHRDHCM